LSFARDEPRRQIDDIWIERPSSATATLIIVNFPALGASRLPKATAVMACRATGGLPGVDDRVRLLSNLFLDEDETEHC
jgi:hypothetical protein